MSDSVRRTYICPTWESSIEFIDLKEQHRRLQAKIDDAIAKVFEHGRFVMGPEVADLEFALEARTQARNVVSCSSGSDALVLVLMGLGIGPGDVVLLPTFTFVATVEAVVLVEAQPFFLDVDSSTLNVDPQRLDEILADWGDGTPPRALIAVDLFGRPCDYLQLNDVTRRYGITLIADAAQSFGATYEGRSVATLATATTTSFFPAKPLGAYGDGGAVFTDDDQLAEVIRSIRVHGSGNEKYHHVRVGLNARLDTIQAAILLVKLSVFDEELRARALAAARYSELLHAVVETPPMSPGATMVWAQYTIQSDHRDVIARELKANGVPTAIYYPVPLHLQSPYRTAARASDLSVAERAAHRVLSLPMHPYLDESTQMAVARLVVSALSISKVSQD